MNKRLNYIVEMLKASIFTDDERVCVKEAINTIKIEYAEGFDHDDLGSAQSKLQIICDLLPELLESIKLDGGRT